MTNGDLSGTNGNSERRAFWICMAGAVLIVLAINSINALSWLSEDPNASLARILITEGSSGLLALALIWLPWTALVRLPLDTKPWWRTMAIHAAAFAVFALIHVAGFLALRQLAFRAIGETYAYGPWWDRFLYEARKDAFYYVVILVLFWLLRDRLLRPATSRANAPAVFDIRDGAKLLRTPIADILAVSSAGNYAEFHLADGRKPLMRTALSSLETQLAVHGFVRTHRSWLVNAARVTELKPEGSGDYAVTLGGVTAPLSRRFPEALAKLRG